MGRIVLSGLSFLLVALAADAFYIRYPMYKKLHHSGYHGMTNRHYFPPMRGMHMAGHQFGGMHMAGPQFGGVHMAGPQFGGMHMAGTHIGGTHTGGAAHSPAFPAPGSITGPRTDQTLDILASTISLGSADPATRAVGLLGLARAF